MHKILGMLPDNPTTTASSFCGLPGALPYEYKPCARYCPDALAVAEQNIEEHGLIHNVIPIRSDLFRDLPKVQYDLIVTNPPYVDAEDMSDLPNEYRHEPELGLASGTDGLKLTRRILGNAADYLADDGVLICEVGNSMVHLMEQYPDVPFTWLEFDNGGDGVFMLTKEQLLAAREHFAIYKD